MPVERIGVLTRDVVKLRDSAELRFGDGAQGADWAVGDVSIAWDGTDLDMLPTSDDTVFKIGNGTLSMDVWLYGAMSTAALIWDASASKLYATGGASIAYNDDSPLVLGNSADVSIAWDATNLVITAAADDSVIEIGDANATQASFDVKVYGNNASGGSYMLWDASTNGLQFSGGSIIMQDADKIYLGSQNDIAMSFDGTSMIVLPTTDDTKIEFGISAGTQKSPDVRFWGNDSASYMMWDASASRLAFLSGGYGELKTWTVSGGAVAITYGTSGSTGYIPIYTTAT